MENYEEELSNAKYIKTNDSKKKPVKAENKKGEAAKNSPKRKNPPKKPKKEKSTKKAENSFEEENFQDNLSNSEKDSDDDFDSQAKKKSAKQKQVKKKEKQPKEKEKGGCAVQGKDDSTILVLEYMRKQNRPYSLINILDNLHGEIKKTQGQKILDQLSESGELQMKEYGKSKIYLINQKNIPVVDPKEMENLKILLEKGKTKHTSLSNEIKTLKKKETELNNQLSNEQLEEEIERYIGLIKESDEKIESFQSENYVKIPDNVIQEAETHKNKIEKEYKKRKRFCTDMINQLAEMMEKKVKEIEELIGIEKE